MRQRAGKEGGTASVLRLKCMPIRVNWILISLSTFSDFDLDDEDTCRAAVRMFLQCNLVQQFHIPYDVSNSYNIYIKAIRSSMRTHALIRRRPRKTGRSRRREYKNNLSPHQALPLDLARSLKVESLSCAKTCVLRQAQELFYFHFPFEKYAQVSNR